MSVATIVFLEGPVKACAFHFSFPGEYSNVWGLGKGVVDLIELGSFWTIGAQLASQAGPAPRPAGRRPPIPTLLYS